MTGGTYAGGVVLPSSLKVLGGFAGTESAASQRDWAANVTVIDGGGAGRVLDIPAGAPGAVIDGVVIQGGAADSGAGVRSAAIAPVIANVIFRNNAGAAGAGALTVLNASSGAARVVNCLFTSNTSSGGAGAVVLDNSAGVLFANNTVAGNTSAAGFGAVHVSNASASVSNAIIAFNVGGGGLSASGGAAPALVSNNVFSNAAFAYQGVAQGATDITTDPRFVNRPGGDFRLGAGSPCIDSGANSVPAPAEFAFDLAHKPRRSVGSPGGSAVIDRGAFEAACTAPACSGDLNGDARVDTADLVSLLGRFGQSVAPGSTGDLNADGLVNTADLVLLLGRFGQTCPVCP